MMRYMLLRSAAVAMVFAATAAHAQVSAQVSIGQLIDYSGPTADVGVPFGQGAADAMGFVNQKGGVNHAKVNVDAVDYGYQVPRAVSQYKKWASEKVAAILGWGTADTEALTGFV